MSVLRIWEAGEHGPRSYAAAEKRVLVRRIRREGDIRIEWFGY